ncbi:hypothetical protein M378DRAFT_8264 [Amanita muscaria Koide BX008]|uniref:Protein kinase domain-containing protein n=1 Tax=Amanita muscaria (strain Koide BX008) TaxID=946122 RepID=A0A0C2X3R2_AMAMK|nr:hypothetical protein M378DRAFT_8264 [Amanita muscaria Koide BX008]
MLASTPTKDYVALPNPSTISPSYRTRYCTPQRARKDATKYDSVLLSPSPLRQRPLFPVPKGNTDVADDLFMQSPFKSPAPAQFHVPYPTQPQPIAADDDDGSIFLSSSSTSPTIPVSLSQPLRTPVKQSFGLPTRPVLLEKQLNTTPFNSKPTFPATDATRVGLGVKRKQNCQNVSTPLRPHTLSPLKVAASKTVDPRATTCFMFDRLAPLEAPKFITRTPQTKAETEAYLRRQTATLTKLKLADLHNSDDEFSLHSVRDLDDEMDGFAPGGGSGYKLVANRGKDKEEVVEAVSPGGHVTKRRARSRPVSAELLESALHPSSPTKRSVPSTNFPSTRSHTRTSSGSSMEATSPRTRRRVGGASHPYAIRSIPSPQPPRVHMNRVSSGSSASLFFGPSIPSSDFPPRNRATSSATAASTLCTARPKVNHRHSYSGLGDDPKTWNTIQPRAVFPSPESSPARGSYGQPRRSSVDADEDAFFNSSSNMSFQMCVTEGTPSPRTRRLDPGTLQRKYRARDSGVVISDDDEESPLNSSSNGNASNMMPRASTSDGSLNSDDGLITPGIAPDLGSGWPTTDIFIHGTDDTLRQDSEVDVDTFIMRTLSTASKGANDGVKKAPGTPVKRARTTFVGTDRPWQSAVAPKVGLRYDLGGRTSKVPRKSLPAVLTRKMDDEQSTESEREDDSPIASRGKYSGIGLGRPQLPAAAVMRNSSGAFSSGSDSASLIGTPTRTRGNGKDLVPLSKAALKRSPTRTASNSSTGSSIMTISPVKRSRPLHLTNSERPPPRSSSLARRLIKPSGEEEPGRFLRDFEEIDGLGSGEFGKVIKVQSKNRENSEVYAIKKSKQFEGPKHRLRLREEVEILKHLSQYAISIGIHRCHPNVLSYLDSWEEDEALYIQTELCESGNLARFLWEYGRVFPRLDEARVWKIIVDLSNGLRFIHEAGVIHLDLKPSNIFLTKDGRFKIGDFGMASLWPRKPSTALAGGFEREGDKLYLAPEVLQGRYGKAADMFSFGMTLLETASNIVVPDQGEAWHRLRQEDFSQVDLDDSPELLELIKQLMRTDPTTRISARGVYDHPVVSRARAIMEQTYDMAIKTGTSVFVASPLASVTERFLVEILCRPLDIPMDTSR